jgi:uncharacterized RDD family membrane protein YckC
MKSGSLLRRLGAFLIDMTLLQVCLAFLGRHFTVTGVNAHTMSLFRIPGMSMYLRIDLVTIAELLGFFIYFLLFEQMTRAGSPGKYLAGLVLLDKDGNRPSPWKTLCRTAFKSLLFVFWPLCFIWMLWKRRAEMPYDPLLRVSVLRRLPDEGLKATT